MQICCIFGVYTTIFLKVVKYKLETGLKLISKTEYHRHTYLSLTLLSWYITVAITCHCVFRWPRREFQAEPRTKRPSKCQAALPMLARPQAVDWLLLPQCLHQPPRPPHPSAPMSPPHPRRPCRTPILTRPARPPSGNTGNWQSTSRLLKWQTEIIFSHCPSLSKENPDIS